MFLSVNDLVHQGKQVRRGSGVLRSWEGLLYALGVHAVQNIILGVRNAVAASQKCVADVHALLRCKLGSTAAHISCSLSVPPRNALICGTNAWGLATSAA